jgi:hypothetical protein
MKSVIGLVIVAWSVWMIVVLVRGANLSVRRPYSRYSGRGVLIVLALIGFICCIGEFGLSLLLGN